MKLTFKLIGWLFVAILTFLSLDARSQGTFDNLDFESATVATIPSGQFGSPVSIVDGLPSWSGFIGNSQQIQIWHNNVSLGAPVLVILGPDFAFGRIEGNFSVLLTASSQSVSISQSGTVPAFAQSLLFKAIPGSGNFDVGLGGSSIPLIVLDLTPSYILYGGDISSFANQSTELRFTAFSSSVGLNNLYLDSISFSQEAVPEPSTIGLLALGGLLLGWRFARVRR